MQVADLNGDGLSDLLYQKNGNLAYRLSTGINFAPEQIAQSTFAYNKSPVTLTQYNFKGSVAIDVSADGKTDFLLSNKTKDSNGDKWTVLLAKADVSDPTKIVFQQKGIFNVDKYKAHQFGDVNGDGKLDLLSYSHDKLEIRYSTEPNKLMNVISSYDNGYGVYNRIVYSGITSRYNNFFNDEVAVYIKTDSTERYDTDNSVNNDYISPKTGYFVVSRVDSDITEMSAVSVLYQYGGLLIHKNGFGMLGFQTLRTIDAQTCTDYVDYESYPNVSDSSSEDGPTSIRRPKIVTNYNECVTTETVYHQRFPYTGMPKSTIQTLGLSGTAPIMSQATNIWTEASTANGALTVYLQKSIEQQYSLNDDLSKSDLLNVTTTNNVQDSYGNITNIKVEIEDGSDSSTDKHYTETSNIYGVNAKFKKLGRLTNTSVTKYLLKNNVKAPVNGVPGNIVRSSSFTYNNDLMLETSVTELGTTTYGYDKWGNKDYESYAAKDSANSTSSQRETFTEYYGRGRYIKNQTGIDNITTTYVYNSSTATPNGRIELLSTSDNNGNKTTTEIGWFGKAGLKTKQLGNSPVTLQSQTFTQFCSSLTSGTCPEDAFIRHTQVASGAPEKQVFTDKFGREVRSQIQNFNNTWTVVDKTYDEQGRAKTVTEPSFGTGSAYLTELFYDRIGRVVKEVRPTGIVTSSRKGLVTEHRDERVNDSASEWAQISRVTRDFTGAIEKSESLNKSGVVLASTLMRYNANNELVSSSVNGDDVNVIFYDQLGRKTKMKDDTKGTWQYDYNSFGELIWQQNSEGSVSSFYYDSAGRKIARVDEDGLTCWAYDDIGSQYKGALLSVQYIKGKNQSYDLCNSISNANYTEEYLYSSSGQIYRTTTTIDGEQFTTEQYYDDYLRPNYTSYPGGKLVTKQTYNDIGMPTSVVNVTEGHRDFGKVYQRLVEVDARGNSTVVEYANGVRQTRAYKAETGRIDTLSIYRGSNMLHRLDYTFDAIGNLTKRAHNFGYGGSSSDFCESFKYDNHYRLMKTSLNAGTTSCNNNVSATQDIRYDTFGNILFKQGVGTYEYTDPDDKYKLKAIRNSAGNQIYNFQYDDRGNIYNDGTRTFAYTAFDKPSRISKGSVYSEFKYDHNRNLYKRIDQRNEGRTETLYLKGLYERLTLPSGNVEHKYYVGNTVVIDSTDAKQSKTLYTHKDHLGSTVTVTDANGSVVQHINYDAWGKQNRFYTSSSLVSLLNQQSPVESKGYTGHKEISDLGIIHMNGRIYDPTLGRFLQADPFIQFPDNSQSYNRYSYVLNNPMRFTDSSGFFIDGFITSLIDTKLPHPEFKFLAKNPALATIAQIAGTAVTTYYCGPCSIGFNAWYTKNLTYAQTGNMRAAYTSAAITGATSAAFYGIGASGWSDGAKVFAHAMVGGISAHIQGGKFGHGFIAAGFTKFVQVNGVVPSDMAGGIIVSATIGGTMSVITGGKFANGAITAAFQFALNNWLSSRKTLKEALVEASMKNADEMTIAGNADKYGTVIYKDGDEFIIGRSSTDVPFGLTIGESPTYSSMCDGFLSCMFSGFKDISFVTVAPMPIENAEGVFITVPNRIHYRSMIESHYLKLSAKVGAPVYVNSLKDRSWVHKFDARQSSSNTGE
nr:RHS repeat-associated core domain-containing protein [Pseudoalteromonas shioyasakiensis]